AVRRRALRPGDGALPPALHRVLLHHRLHGVLSRRGAVAAEMAAAAVGGLLPQPRRRRLHLPAVGGAGEGNALESLHSWTACAWPSSAAATSASSTRPAISSTRAARSSRCATPSGRAPSCARASGASRRRSTRTTPSCWPTRGSTPSSC